MNHLQYEQLLDYAAERLESNEMRLANEHFADCPSCRDRVGTLLFLRQNFEEVWEDWNAGTAVLSEKSLARSVSLRDIFARARAHVTFLVDHGRRVANQVAGDLAEGLTFELRPLVAGVGAGAEDLAFDQHLIKSGELLKAGQAEESLEELWSAAHINSFATQTSSAYMYLHGVRFIELQADSVRRRVLMRCWPNSGAQPPELAVLLSGEAHVPPRIAHFESQPDEEYLLATFDDIPNGAFQILLSA